ncbi:hypothetical protein FNV43_RR02089 [Rhamnella rubrinervis]|uniref:Piwi domain-containing protein n=1 Tax=Rhamnella rubrinervis TaxID=2594499 RepID=A0A8K0MSN0_9ROSA|nr:hypothetical protein FNV43_RR02089 [Rhamnella rubrinervis]
MEASLYERLGDIRHHYEEQGVVRELIRRLEAWILFEKAYKFSLPLHIPTYFAKSSINCKQDPKVPNRDSSLSSVVVAICVVGDMLRGRGSMWLEKELVFVILQFLDEEKFTETVHKDGVSESQFSQVLNMELDQVIEVLRAEHCPLDLVTQINILCIFQACKFLDENWSPKFAVIVAQKNHHTKFFKSGSSDNVPPGIGFSMFIEGILFVKHDPYFMQFLFLQL